VLGTEPVTVLLDERPQTLGHQRVERREAAAQLPAPADRHEGALPAQGLHQLHQEQRVAVRPPVQRGDHGWGDRRARQARRHHRRHGRRGQHLEDQLHTVPVQRQGRLQGLEGVPMHDHLHRAIRAQEQQPRGRAPLRQIRHQGQRGLVAPVQILEHQHQGPHGGQRLDGLGTLPQHALWRGALHLALQRLTGRGAEDGGQL
jgi:hypothetical protein